MLSEPRLKLGDKFAEAVAVRAGGFATRMIDKLPPKMERVPVDWTIAPAPSAGDRSAQIGANGSFNLQYIAAVTTWPRLQRGRGPAAELRGFRLTRNLQPRMDMVQ